MLVAACGRIGFAPLGSGDDGNGSDGSTTLDTALDLGLVLDIPFDQPLSGRTTADLAYAHLVQCPVAGCATLVPGHAGNAYHFDGSTTSYMTVGYSNDLDPTNGFTVAAWVRLDALSISSFDCFFTKPYGIQDLDSYSLCVDPQAHVMFESSDGVNPNGDMVTGPTLAFGTWHHMAMTWDPMTKLRKSYLDGGLLDTFSTSIVSDTNDLAIASDNNTQSQVYQVIGAVDALRVYSRALSAAEIGALAK
jgi:hypothetical protein